MFSSGIYITGACIILLALLIIWKGYHRYNTIRTILIGCIVVSAIYGFTPFETTLDGPPFANFSDSTIAYLSCSYHVGLQARFCEGPMIQEADCYCTNPNAMATIAYCYKTGYSEQIESFLNKCTNELNLPVTREQFDNSYRYYNEFSKPLNKDYNKEVLHHPITLNDSNIFLFKGAYDQFLGNYNRSIIYGDYLIIYWIVVFLLASLVNWSKIILPSMHKKLVDPFSNFVRRHLTLPATKGKNKTNHKTVVGKLTMLVPTRLESIILVTFFILVMFLLTYNIRFFEGDPIFKAKLKALCRYHAVRASILLSEIMPLLILFGGRNNFLQWLTRWDFSTFMTFHRWVSRIILFLLIIHVVGYGYCLIVTNLQEAIDTYIVWGYFATIAGITIMIQGLLVLRRSNYELFLFLHILLSFAFLIGSWYHVKGLFCAWFYYASGMVWLTDRVIRLAKIISFGFPQASVSLLPDKTLKIEVPTPKDWEAIPGGHVFIHFLRPNAFWQSHPFTYTSLLDKPNTIVLFVKVKEGVTRSLHNYLLKHPKQKTSIRVAVEGSYGESTPASRFESSVFVAGGSGIPGIYSEAYDLARRTSKNKIKLYWVIREYDSLLWFLDELHLLKEVGIDTTIYVTKPNLAKNFINIETSLKSNTEADRLLLSGNRINSYQDVSLKSYDEQVDITKLLETLSHIKFVKGRPSMDLVVKQNIKEAMGAICFVTCGPPVMVDDLRAAVADNLNNDESKRLDYFEQLQVWA